MPELRKDPISGQWVILSPEHALHLSDSISAARDPIFAQAPATCPLCPGNEIHAPGEVYARRPAAGASPGAVANAPGWSLRVVPHKFPALRIEGDLDRHGHGVYDRMNGIGAHEVLIETAAHGQQLPDLSAAEIADVLLALRHRIQDLRRDQRFRYVAVFKAFGQRAGALFGHGHTQLIALPALPRDLQARIAHARSYYRHKERCVLCDVVRQEIADRSRLVHKAPEFVALCPYASRTPFETWVLPRRHHPAFEDGPEGDLRVLASTLRVVLRKLRLALDTPAYLLMLHNAPFQHRDRLAALWHYAIEILPLIGRGGVPGLLPGCPINPTPPEEAAHYLRGLDAERESIG